MSKDKNTSGKGVSKDSSKGRFIKNPAKPGSIQPNRVDKAIKKVAGRKTGTVTSPHS